MSESQSPHSQSGTGNLKNALAVLISCTHNKKRPLPLTEIARSLEVAVTKLGSYAAVAGRIGLSVNMLRQFAFVRRLTTSVQEMFKNRQIDSVDAAVHLAMLPPNEQLLAAKALASCEIDTGDIRAAIRLRNVGQKGAITGLLCRVKEGKTKQEYVAEFVVRGTHDHASILSAFKKHILPEDIVSLELDGVLGRLVLTQKGKQALTKAATTLNVPLKYVISTILQG